MPFSQLSRSRVESSSLSSGLSSRPSSRPLWKKLFRETRTRILLMYSLILLLLTSLSIPLFKYLLFESINKRVREDLETERILFLEAYTDWATNPQHTVEDLRTFVDQSLNGIRPQDDNFQIVLIDGELYRSNPSYLLKPLRPGSSLFGRWQATTQFTVGEEKIASVPDIGSVIYTADPIVLNGQIRGVFVAAHSSAGERQEAFVGIYLFIGFMVGAVLISLLLSWLGAGRLMAPIAGLAKTARAIGEADLTQRIPPPKSDGELAELTHTFNAMMDRIQAAFDSQRNFINDAGHELRTPITIIQGHLELLDGDPQERQETMELVMDELDRMGRLVNDLLLLAKAERPNFLQLETIDVRLFTEELFAKAMALAERHWVLALPGQGKLVGDRQKITGALLNLLRNAAQYTQPTDTIELGCRLIEQGQIQFWVRDTGEGISLEDQQQIFARFARGRQRQRRSEGSGLGLAIVSAIAEAHGGDVTLVSQVGKGARFQMTLPMESPQVAVEPL
jgi:signal transduction histidine kinase